MIKRIVKVFCVLCFSLILVVNVRASSVIDIKDNTYVNDETGSISDETIESINNTVDALKEASGAEIGIAVIDFLDGQKIEDYAYTLFNKWGLGDKTKNNGLLYLISLGDGEYYSICGSGLEKVFKASVLSNIQDGKALSYLQDGKYDSAILAFVDDSVTVFSKYYDIKLKVSDKETVVNNSSSTNDGNNGYSIMENIEFIAMVAFVILVLLIFVFSLSINHNRRVRGTLYRRPSRYFAPRTRYVNGRNPMHYGPRPHHMEPRGFTTTHQASRSVSSSRSSARSSSSRSFDGGSSRGGGAGGKFGRK